MIGFVVFVSHRCVLSREAASVGWRLKYVLMARLKHSSMEVRSSLSCM